ncbi:putative geraniol 8-hydroxylase [Iris pallida]|uniref:Geraniol 8-hydroxylase n=1 Tax=Iris pallida TaxID=29817 RepID=A0AAX6HEW6_IRIPA|nr:putative geraniol 8-hydroxylase [Iris pallida]
MLNFYLRLCGVPRSLSTAQLFEVKFQCAPSYPCSPESHPLAVTSRRQAAAFRWPAAASAT